MNNLDLITGGTVLVLINILKQHYIVLPNIPFTIIEVSVGASFSYISEKVHMSLNSCYKPWIITE